LSLIRRGGGGVHHEEHAEFQNTRLNKQFGCSDDNQGTNNGMTQEYRKFFRTSAKSPLQPPFV